METTGFTAITCDFEIECTFRSELKIQLDKQKNTSRCCYFYIFLPHAEIDKPAK